MTFHSSGDFFSNEKSFFIVQRILFQIFGFWPGSEVIRSWQIAFAVFNALEIAVNGIFQINFCIKNSNDLVLFLNGITPLVTQAITVQKILVMTWKRKDIKKVLNFLKESFLNGNF